MPLVCVWLQRLLVVCRLLEDESDAIDLSVMSLCAASLRVLRNRYEWKAHLILVIA